MRARLLFVMIASGCAVSAATACSSPDVALEGQTKKATQASSVTISMFDKAGSELGSCSGTLVAKDLVLTAGHCVAGAAKWTVDARGADATSEATRAVTPWKAFGSDLSHPDHSDVALLVLDTPIALDSYPAIATSKLADGAKALRFSRTAASAAGPASSEIAVSSMSKKGFRLNYAAKIDKGGYVDTGGAVIDPKTGKIHGVISGVGNESGLLHIARVDNFAKWITKATSCMSATSLATRTYGTSSGGSSSGGWGAGGGDWGGYGGNGDKLDGGGSSSGSSGMDGGAGSSGTSGSSSGTSGSAGSSSGSSGTTGGSSGSSGSAGGGDTSGAGSSCPGVPTCEGSDCPGVPGGGTPGSGSSGTSGSSGSDGTNGSSSGSSGASSGSSGTSSGSSGTSSGSSGTSSGSSGTSGSSGSDGTNGGGDEVCPGPPNCPEPDSQACTGAACGGCGGVAGCVDATIDYGSCASCGAPSGTGTPPVVR